MDAIDFVKKFGISRAKDQLESPKLVYGAQVDYQFMNDLKQIVDAFELVEVGLPELKKLMFSESKDLDYVKNWSLTVSEKLLTEKGIKLKQSIELVEKCHASD